MPLTPATTDKFQKVGLPGSATTLSAPGYTIGNSSITVGATTNHPTDTLYTFAIDQVQVVNGVQSRVAGTYCEFEGMVTGANTIGSLSLKYGNPQNYTAGATTRVYIPVSSNRENALIDGLNQDHNGKGNHKTLTDDNNNEWLERGQVTSAVNQLKVTNAATGNGPIISASGDDANINLNLKPKGSGKIVLQGFSDGWQTGALPAVSSVTCNGNRSYDIVFASTVAALLSPGMRLRTTRSVIAPTYMAGALNGTNQYFTKVTPTGTLGTVTDNFSFVGHIMLTSYPSSNVAIAARGDATPNNGIEFLIDSSGRLGFAVFNGSSSNWRQILSVPSIPLNKKVHVAGTWAAGVVTLYIDGISVTVNAATSSGTAPTTAGTGGDFSIGRMGAFNGHYFPGYIGSVGVFNAVLAAATIRNYSGQVLTGAEANCIGAWDLNNRLTDQNAAGNTLTAQGSAGFASGVSPYSTNANGVSDGTYDFAIVTKVNGATATVQVPEGCTLDTRNSISAVDVSGVKAPYGMPIQKSKWRVETLILARYNRGTSATTTPYTTNTNILIPVGEWLVSYELHSYSAAGTAGNHTDKYDLATADATVNANSRFLTSLYMVNLLECGIMMRSAEISLSLAAAATYYLNMIQTSATTYSAFGMLCDFAPTQIIADLGLL